MSFDSPCRMFDPQEMTIGPLLMQVCRLAGDRLRVKMEKIGLHRGQGFVLLHLFHRDGIAQQEIALAKHVSPATVTSMLQRMERDGWIKRRRDEHDERIVRVYVTEKAQALHTEARASFSELDAEVTEVLTDAERETFQDLLRKVHARLVERSPRGQGRQRGLHSQTNADAEGGGGE